MAGESLRVSDIMTTAVVSVDPDDTLRDVVDALSTRGVHGAPVISAGRVVGVISVSDILEFMATTPAVPVERADFAEWGELEETDPEVDDQDSRAFYTDLWDDAGADVADRFDTPDSPEWDLLKEYTASTVMTRKLEHISPDAPVSSAARQILNSGVHRLLVMRGQQLAGIVSATDFVRLALPSGAGDAP